MCKLYGTKLQKIEEWNLDVSFLRIIEMVLSKNDHLFREFDIFTIPTTL